MALQLSTGYRNGILDLFETTVGASGILKVFTGSPPATCATADTGTTLTTITLPADFMASASGGSKALSGTWQDLSADNNGTPGYFRIYPSAATTTNAVIQGTVTITGGGGDMTFDSVSWTAGQQINVTSFTLTAPGA